MFLNNVKITRIKSWSLVSRLMVLYSLSTIGILGAICLFLYPTFSKIFQNSGTILPNYLTVECFEKVIIALLAASLGAIFLGYYIAKNGLNRIQEFSDKMESISAESLHERINPNDWPTELKSLGNKFNLMLDRLQVSFNQLTQFSSDIAHELRNPLNNLTGITELTLANNKTIEEYKHILESNQEEYRYLTRLIENLLFLAQADHGQTVLDKIPLDAGKEAKKICDYYQAIADEKSITLTCEGTAEISADPTLFKRVLSNLLANALRYTSAGGSIQIHIQQIDAEQTQISIQDNGIGISEEHLPHLCDRFYRVDPSRSSQSGGLGLGLAIVKSIIELHRGSINIESEREVGTNVIFQLPGTSLRAYHRHCERSEATQPN